MTDFHPDPALRAFTGQADREHPILELLEFGPWHASVIVTPIRLRRARSSQSFHIPREIEFEVLAEWTGDPLPGTLPSSEPVHSRALYMTGEIELARAIALHAEHELRKPAVPDLREAAKHLRARLAGGPYA